MDKPAHKSRTGKYCAICWLLVALVCTANGQNSPSYKIRFGIVEYDPQTGRKTIHETSVIPFKLKDTGFRFGFEIIPPDDLPYNFQTIDHLPSPPKQLTGILENGNPTKPTATVKSPVEKASGVAYLVQKWFDPGDPTGDYNIDVFVNGTLQQTITFTVVSK